MTDLFGMALIHFVWQGAVIAISLAVALRVSADARLRYALACTAMLAMVASVVVTLAVLWPDRVAVAHSVPFWAPLVDASSGAGPAGHRQDFLPLLVGLWILGAGSLCVYRLGGWIAAMRMRQLASRIGEFRSIALLESALTEAPVVMGVLRPAILVPVGMLTALPPAQLEAILLHELAHIRRSDYLVNLVQTAVESLLFYHPAVWWVSRIIREEREKCCDDAVVGAQGDPRTYVEALLSLETWRGREPAIAATGGDLLGRIRRLLNQPEERRSAGAAIVATALLLGVLCAAAIAQQKPATEESLKAELATPYRKWVDEDVAYIIEPREREAFQKLRTDAEREKFVEQFWERRNPVPGSRENKFKEEHYRRIAYTNDHFSAALPGWKTDCGRIYIRYGPPDELEQHGPVELWRYKAIPGVGANVIIEFVDHDGKGDYRMTADPWKGLDLPVRPPKK